MKKNRKSMEETLKNILSDDAREYEGKSRADLYSKLKSEKDEGNEKVTELFFQNVSLGKERAKIEKEIKLLQARSQTLKSAENYLELLAEEIRKKISETSEAMRLLEEDPEVKRMLQKEKQSRAKKEAEDGVFEEDEEE